MTSDGKPGQDFIHKHMPDILNRLLTEIKGAPFVTKVSGSGKASKKAQGNDRTSGAGAVDISDLLHPKKKARKASAKSKAKAAAKKEDTAPEAEVDVEVAIDGPDGGATRARWWVDDLIGCLQHAAGGLYDFMRKTTGIESVREREEIDRERDRETERDTEREREREIELHACDTLDTVRHLCLRVSAGAWACLPLSVYSIQFIVAFIYWVLNSCMILIIIHHPSSHPHCSTVTFVVFMSS